MDFRLKSVFKPTGDQPQAIEKLTEGVKRGDQYQTLLGATGTGKTFTVANVIQNTQKPTLVMAHNKTLAAQLASEFREFFPENAVEYFVSYYDYYQPEAYVASRDLFIEKDSTVNEEIDRLRLAATNALVSRKDVIIVASVSCIYNIGSPEAYVQSTLKVEVGQTYARDEIFSKLTSLQYDRNDTDLGRGNFRVKGEIIEIHPAYGQFVYRLEFFGDELQKITSREITTQNKLEDFTDITIYPARHYMMPRESMMGPLKDIQAELNSRVKDFKKSGKIVEAQRLEQRTNYDLEMIEQLGYCSGIENYSRYFDGRAPGQAPFTLLDYFHKDYLLVVDESHMSLPQIRGMWHGERARKDVLIDHGFRLPSAIDNRPLTYEEFQRRTGQTIYTSATPNPYELGLSSQVVEQVIRPTGIVDPTIDLRPTEGQIPDLIQELNTRIKKGQRVLITTLTKRMSEELTTYLQERNIKVMYLHSDVETLERVEILRDLRLGVYDVIVGINLLREGLDLPEVSLVAILDADKEGFLRSRTSLIQTIGRAARHLEGRVILYADKVTDSMKYAMDETNRRRAIQEQYNKEHGITPTKIEKAVKDISERLQELQPDATTAEELDLTKVPPDQVKRLIKDLEREMDFAAKNMEFERAALIRDQINELKREEITLPSS